MPRLILRDGPKPGAVFPLAERAILGRHKDASVVLDDSSVSRQHASIVHTPSGFVLRDLSSRNGTQVNGKRIAGEVVLRNGDRIQLGDRTLEFELEETGHRDLPTATLETREALETRASPQRREEADGTEFPRPLGHFVLHSFLGRGGMGEVYRAREAEGGPEVALKVIRAEIGSRESFLDSFHNREAVLAREIDHPNVIKVLEHGAMGSRHYVVMEFVDGESLLDVLKRGPLPLDVALEIVRQVACGLHAAHQRGVVHSDIKPANVMVLRRPVRAATTQAASARTEGAGVLLEFPDKANRPAETGRYDGALRQEILRRLGAARAEPVDPLLDPPFFPRASEMRFLEHYWEGLSAAGGHHVLVEGEAGVGKDRLISEFVRQIGALPSTNGGEVGESVRLFELDASRIEGIPRLHRRLFPLETTITRPSPEAVEEIVGALLKISEPCVLRILSVEAASGLTAELILGLSRVLETRPLLTLSAVSSEAISRSPFVRELRARGGPRLKELHLRPLTVYQVERYLQDLFREPGLDERLAKDFHRISGGSIGRLLETVRDALQRGILAMDPTRGRLVYQPSPREIELLEGKKLYERYRSAGKIEKRVLEHAAFIGPSFLFETLLKFTEIDETALFFLVRDLCGQGFWSETSRTWYRFTNAAFQRHLADQVPARERPRLHRRIAWLLDEAPTDGAPSLLEARARHWEAAGEAPKAVRLLLEGAHRARVEYEIDQARQMYQEILGIYRALATDSTTRRAVTDELRAWFRRDANWYELLGNLGQEEPNVQVKITDFGISFKLPSKDDLWIDQSTPLGTPRYLSPERVRGEAGGPRSDIFALGIILYEAIGGAPPFPGKRGEEVMRANLELEIRPPQLPAEAKTPPEFVELFRGMVEKNPELRWDAARVLRTIAKIQLDQRMG